MRNRGELSSQHVVGWLDVLAEWTENKCLAPLLLTICTFLLGQMPASSLPGFLTSPLVSFLASYPDKPQIQADWPTMC